MAADCQCNLIKTRAAYFSASQGQIKKSAQMIFELASMCSLDSPVARIMNAWCYLIRNQLVALIKNSMVSTPT